MTARKVLLTALMLALDGAIADEHEQPAKEGAEETAIEERVCFNRRLVSTFDGLSDKHVYIKEGTSDFYLLTMRRYCSGLEDARTIMFRDTLNRICSDGFGEVIYRGRGRDDRCRIETVERVQNKDEAKALVAEREDYEKRKKDKKKDED